MSQTTPKELHLLRVDQSFQLEWQKPTGRLGQKQISLQQDIYQSYIDQPENWFLFLGFCEQNSPLSPSLHFWREFSSLFIDHLFKQAINNYEGSATVILLGTSSEFKSFSKGLSKHPDGYGKLRRML